MVKRYEKRNIPINEVADIAPHEGVMSVFMKDAVIYGVVIKGHIFPLNGVRFVDKCGFGQELQNHGRICGDLVLNEFDILLGYDSPMIARFTIPAGTEILFSNTTTAGFRLPGFLERVNALPCEVKKHVLSTL